ncbi:hypothetical protein L1887_55241 [Cichorium endivia]|nr:hypothetical protein L1887_55241 [Cichorium endivia]
METGRPLAARDAAGKVALLKVAVAADAGEVVAAAREEGLEPELEMLPLEPKCAEDAARSSAARCERKGAAAGCGTLEVLGLVGKGAVAGVGAGSGQRRLGVLIHHWLCVVIGRAYTGVSVAEEVVRREMVMAERLCMSSRLKDGGCVLTLDRGDGGGRMDGWRSTQLWVARQQAGWRRRTSRPTLHGKESSAVQHSTAGLRRGYAEERRPLGAPQSGKSKRGAFELVLFSWPVFGGRAVCIGHTRLRGSVILIHRAHPPLFTMAPRALPSPSPPPSPSPSPSPSTPLPSTSSLVVRCAGGLAA